MKDQRLRACATTFALLLSSYAGGTHAKQYAFEFLANPDASQAGTADPALDVRHRVVVDTDKLSGRTAESLGNTVNWFNGAITATMSHQGRTVRLNDAIDPTWSRIDSALHSDQGGFISAYPSEIGPWFYALEFAPGDPFIDGNKLPYDPFVYGFLFVYADQKPFQDFTSFWRNTSLTTFQQYEVSAVPEPSTTALALVGGLLMRGCVRRRR